MFSAVCLLASSGILFYILKYRVHVHVTYTRPSTRGQITRKGRRAEASGCNPARPHMRDYRPTAMTRPVQQPESIVWGDIASALINLGANKKQARAAALKACREYPDAPFNSVFTAALQEVGRAA